MNYSAKRPCSGNAAAAFGAVEATLLPNGFRIVRSEPSRREFQGRGMHSTKENPVRGATKIQIEAVGGSLRLNAALGGVLFMALFVCLFPLLLWGGLSVAALLKSGDASGVFSSKAIWGAAIWFVVGPAMAAWIRRRTISALEDMLENAVEIAGRG